ncbi:hypothetical protein PPK15_gp77 [Bacillus phage 000TH010]|uniref:Uncharacterized protein n=1 Tax=Bacillus phage 000TH010 TaxID=2601652 RepID=A0A5P8PJP5_9CAUD|nr:hypothetical protein PPK15_gp77 [Bacillus phage 000TH010]QFR56290.1 hypothetical protein 000TH010_77 [Bacillus phage 000TH010]
MNIRDIIGAAIEAIHEVHRADFAIEVIQFRSDVWDGILEYHKERGGGKPTDDRFEFCGISTERKELMENAFRIVTFGTDLGGVINHEIVTESETTFTYSIVTPIRDPFITEDIFKEDVL